MKKGFTLAEVLITLGIIGVVAALTMPGLITNYQKKAMAVKLKQTYSLLKNAEQLATIEYGRPQDWDYNTVDGTGGLNIPKSDLAGWFEKYYAPYLKLQKMPKSYLYTMSSKIKNIDGAAPYAGFQTSPLPSYQLANGVVLTPWANNQYFVFAVDLNGKASPNVIGKDIFDFEVYYIAPRTLVTPGRSTSDRSAAISQCRSKTYTSGGPSPCSWIISQDGWEIAPDYPW